MIYLVQLKDFPPYWQNTQVTNLSYVTVTDGKQLITIKLKSKRRS